ncbi:MAG: DUF1684 domain-containing protein [Ignavibacteria bacterium]|nr:DUF1684 domain-containing protein [Ignavibacteria bacterium]
MIRIKKNNSFLILIVAAFSLFNSCDEKIPETKEMKEYVKNLLQERTARDSSFKFEPHSPFNRDTTIEFENLKYFDLNPDYIFKSKLFYKDQPDSVVIMGTKGEARAVLVLGYLELNYNGETHQVNVYRGFSKNGEEYHSIWFTDKTTGNETYGVGRYLDIELNEDKNFIYEIDFNRAYNPYCAYSSLYTCPIPREEDHIKIFIEAGEKNFH